MDNASIKLEVPLGPRTYPIHIGSNLLANLSRFTPSLKKVSHAVVVYDVAVESLVGGVETSLSDSGIRVSRIGIPSGEASKDSDHLVRIWNEMLQSKADRASVVVAIGGGVIGDLAGFAAASFVRGIRLIQIPTTLLSQVDSSVGGKTGINLPGAKNIVGAFWQPSLVVIDTQTLNTLPEREFRSGIAEIVKYGVIMDEALFEWLERNVADILNRYPDALSEVIARCCSLKARVVSEDEHETTGARAMLNYGHTFGHALEAATGYGELLHGEAVSIGMAMAGALAVDQKRWDAECLERQNLLLERFGLPIRFTKVAAEKILELMARDKKSLHGKIGFVLPSRIGHVDVGQSVDGSLVLESLQKQGCP